MSIKYLSSYSGPSYGSMDQEYMDGHGSLYRAMQSMRNRQEGMDWVYPYRENSEGVYGPEKDGEWDTVLYPATTRDDVMWVYWAVPEDGGYILGDLAYCITVGSRGGVRSEKA